MKIQKMLDNLPMSENNFPYREFKKKINSSFTLEQENSFQGELEKEISFVFDFINKKFDEDIEKSHEELSMESFETLRTEMYEFSDFINVNIIAIKRIIERHDKITGFKLMENYKERIKEKLALREKVTQLIQSLRYNKDDLKCEATCISKFWIPQQSLIDIKLEIMRHLEKKKENEKDLNADMSYISSVYLDNTEFSLYSSFINKEESGFFIRLRWFGTNSEIVTCELLKCLDSVSKPVVHSIKIPKKQVLGFINGDNIWNSLKDQGNNKDIYNEIQDKIKNYRLRPTVRTFCKRTVFTSHNIKGLKVYLDSNIAMIKECTNHDFEADQLPLRSWARSDVGYDWPFRNLASSEVVRFPFSVLEIIKDESIPLSPANYDWIENILSKSNIEKVPRFSKFIHGCSLLYPSKKIAPGWLPKTFDHCDGDDTEIVSRNQFSNEFLRGAEDSDVSYNLTPISADSARVAIPVKIEPKVFFANERTFLSWIQFAIFLGGVGTAMIGLGNAHAYLSGVMLIGVSAVFALYALFLFHDRSIRMKVKDIGPYDNVTGPVILTGIFILVMILSFIFKFPIKKNNLKI